MEKYRRSKGSFVDHRRKSLTLNNIFIDYTQEESKSKHSVKSYLESLKKEKQDWKDILREKKLQCKNYETQCKSAPLTITRTNVDKFITPDDKEFLENKPNYLDMVELVKKYIDAVNYLNKYKSDIIDYYDKAYNELEVDRKILIEEMCASDLCEICNIKNCILNSLESNVSKPQSAHYALKLSFHEIFTLVYQNYVKTERIKRLTLNCLKFFRKRQACDKQKQNNLEPQ